MYAKIFSKIFDSSIADDWQQRVVFQDILVLCNRDGIIDMTHEAISRRTNVPIEIVRESIAKLESPDPKSNTPDEDGRRIERLDEHRDWGWRIVNYTKYRDIKNSEEMRAATRERVKRWREKKNKAHQNGFSDECKKVLAHLNQKSGRNFRDGAASLEPIEKRLREKDVTIDGVLKMVDRQTTLWKGDSKMEEYLRPSTLFRERNFNEYYAARELPISKVSNGSSVFALKEIINAKEAQCAGLKLKHCSEVAGGDSWSDDKSKKLYFSIRREIKELNGRIANSKP